MTNWLSEFQAIDWALAGALLVALVIAVVTRRRGGRFRRLLGWVGFWTFFSVLLVSLAKLPTWVGMTLLGLLMFAALRTYLFVVPVRPRDRFAILASYFAIPLALWLAFSGSHDAFLVTVPIGLFLLFPVLLMGGQHQDGLLDSFGRVLFGVVLFVFCAAHLGLMAGSVRLELFGLMALAADLPQRLAGRAGGGEGFGQPVVGIGAGVFSAVAIGWWAGPQCGIDGSTAAMAGICVVLGVTLGGVVTHALLDELTLSAQALHGRGAFLDRLVPTIYAVPLYFHYLNYFA
jgi:phosphatidate cytidylyltransferase